MNKKLVAVFATTAIALTVSAGSIASADNGKGGLGFSNFLSELVTKGTISQSQADAIAKALADKKALAEANRPTQAEMQAHRTAEIAVITSTLGITEATLTSRIKAGDSLATIAGSKKDALRIFSVTNARLSPATPSSTVAHKIENTAIETTTAP